MQGPDADLRHIADQLNRVADALALSADGLPHRLIAAVEPECPSLDERLQNLADDSLPTPARDLVLGLRWLLQRALGGGTYRSTFESMKPEHVQSYIRDILRLRTDAAAYANLG